MYLQIIAISIVFNKILCNPQLRAVLETSK